MSCWKKRSNNCLGVNNEFECIWQCMVLRLAYLPSKSQLHKGGNHETNSVFKYKYGHFYHCTFDDDDKYYGSAPPQRLPIFAILLFEYIKICKNVTTQGGITCLCHKCNLNFHLNRSIHKHIRKIFSNIYNFKQIYNYKYSINGYSFYHV